MEHWQLKQRQGLDLRVKVELSKKKIREFYEAMEGNVYVSFSGGKDSTVLLDLVRSEYPDIPAMFVDTGLEYPEIKEFVRTIPNVTWVRPKMSFKEVLEKYGYPVVSKKNSMGIHRCRNTNSQIQKDLRLYGGINPTSGKKQHPTISRKWHYLIDAPFKISEKCCERLKKEPIIRYNKETKLSAFIGTMACDSQQRKLEYIKQGCNSFDGRSSRSTPIAFWLESDVWQYIKDNNLPYSKIYDMGEKHTGCIFCMFGVHMEKGENRFQRMARTHPKLWDYCINTLGCGKVLDYIGVKYGGKNGQR